MYNIVADNPLAGRQAERNLTLDIYKGILMILVVLGHVLLYAVSDKGGIFFNLIWAVQMPGFMLVAGYFAARKVDSWSAVVKRILLSAQHYALPFFSWFILINCFLLGGYGRNPVTAVSTLLTHVDGGLWFLWVVFILSVVTTLANYMLADGRSKKILKAASALIVCFGLLAGTGMSFGISFLGIKYILYYAVFYCFGWFAKWTEGWWRQWWPKVSNVVVAIALIVFLAIVFNYDLYHAPDNLIGITFRCIAGFTGNLVMLWCCGKYERLLDKLCLGWIGMYTLEIYATHMYVNNLVEMSSGFFTAAGFGNFVASLILTVLFTLIIIAVFKSIPAIDFVFYGKRQKKVVQNLM